VLAVLATCGDPDTLVLVSRDIHSDQHSSHRWKPQTLQLCLSVAVFSCRLQRTQRFRLRPRSPPETTFATRRCPSGQTLSKDRLPPLLLVPTLGMEYGVAGVVTVVVAVDMASAHPLGFTLT